MVAVVSGGMATREARCSLFVILLFVVVGALLCCGEKRQSKNYLRISRPRIFTIDVKATAVSDFPSR